MIKITRKIIILSLLLNTTITLAKEIVISDETTKLVVPLNEKTVQCLIGDYGASSFKIVVPQIKELTYLDHTSRGAPGPCINAGPCMVKSDGTFFPGGEFDNRFPIFHDALKPTEEIQLRVIKKEKSENNQGQCIREYIEIVTSTIRGVEFSHERLMPLATLPATECD